MFALLLAAFVSPAAPPAARVDYAPARVSYTPGPSAVSYAPTLSVHVDNWRPTKIAPNASGSTNVVGTASSVTIEAVRPVAQAVSQTVTSWRSPVGHTHTCPRCGDTWDHAKNTGHTCQECGAQQFTQDRSPRMVPVKVRSVAVPVQSAPAVTYTLPGSSSGCVGGNCPLPRR